MPSPLTVKRHYKEIMNRIAQEEGSGQEEYSDINEKTNKKQKKSRKKRDVLKKKANMTPREKAIYNKKKKLKEIYDCLMFS